MKKLLLLLFIPIVCFGQDVKYSFEGENLKQINVVNANNLSEEERKKIYFYSEWHFKNDSLISRKRFYAKGKYPTVGENMFSLEYPKDELISFIDIEKREGKIHTIDKFQPFFVPVFEITDEWVEFIFTSTTNERSMYFPDGKIITKYSRIGDKFQENEVKSYDINGEVRYIGLAKNGQRYGFIYIDKDGYSFKYEFEDIKKEMEEATYVLTYFHTNGVMTRKEYFLNGKEQLEKRQAFTPSGRVCFNPNDGHNNNEAAFKKYLDNNNPLLIEGIYDVINTKSNLSYRIALTETHKPDDSGGFILYLIKDSYIVYKPESGEWMGDFAFKGRAIKTAVEGIYKVEFIDDSEPKMVNEVAKLDSGAILNFGHYKMIKLYPDVERRTDKPKSGDWAGNGSGIILSSSGHIVTNNHVIEDADNIEIEVKLNGELQKFNAEVVQKDLRNDLAILKIVDVDFDGFGAINYNFKTRSSDVGTKIYTFGYPRALSGMGKEIKVTEGIISSKSGIMGDITTYQITAPIQGGNSGGPLFDDKGNLVGINSSKFKSDETENVNYSIKSSYVLNLIDVLPKSIDLPSSTKLQSLPLTEQIKEISKYVVLVKVK